MVAEFKSDTTTLVDVYLWLKDGKGDYAVFSNGDIPFGWHRMRTYAEGTRLEYKVGVQLRQGSDYTVCLSVVNVGSAAPKASNPAVDGLQTRFSYT